MQIIKKKDLLQGCAVQAHPLGIGVSRSAGCGSLRFHHLSGSESAAGGARMLASLCPYLQGEIPGAAAGCWNYHYSVQWKSEHYC